jgi:hypothetical protein
VNKKGRLHFSHQVEIRQKFFNKNGFTAIATDSNLP